MLLILHKNNKLLKQYQMRFGSNKIETFARFSKVCAKEDDNCTKKFA